MCPDGPLQSGKDHANRIAEEWAQTKPVKKNQNQILTTNTCAFDSLTQLASSTYCDSCDMRKVMDMAQVPIWDLAKRLIAQGIRVAAYHLRAEILLRIFPSETLPIGITRVNCMCPITEAAKKLFETHPSIVETASCSSNVCPIKNKKVNQHVLVINAKSEDVPDLNRLINSEFSSPITLPCLKLIGNTEGISLGDYITTSTNVKQCSGIKKRSLMHSNTHLMIEINNISHDSEFRLIETQLQTFPARIDIKGETLLLRGVISYFGMVREGAEGHYVAYARRNNDHWIEYDDLQDKPKEVSSTKSVKVALVYYTIP